MRSEFVAFERTHLSWEGRLAYSDRPSSQNGIPAAHHLATGRPPSSSSSSGPSPKFTMRLAKNDLTAEFFAIFPAGGIRWTTVFCKSTARPVFQFPQNRPGRPGASFTTRRIPCGGGFFPECAAPRNNGPVGLLD